MHLSVVRWVGPSVLVLGDLLVEELEDPLAGALWDPLVGELAGLWFEALQK